MKKKIILFCVCRVGLPSHEERENADYSACLFHCCLLKKLYRQFPMGFD